jgi:type II secretion system protein H
MRTQKNGFTLIELILVMALLTIAVSVAAPALANFFRGRSLDSEARRLLALTRAGQSRAVSEGVPVELWIDTAENSFGLEAEPSYNTEDARALEFALDPAMRIELPVDTRQPAQVGTTMTIGKSGAAGAPLLSRRPQLPRIRFLPDGSIGSGSPSLLLLWGRDESVIVLTQSRNRMRYEIRNRTESDRR